MKAVASAFAFLFVGTCLARSSQGQDGNCTLALLELSSPKGSLINCDAEARYVSQRGGTDESDHTAF